MFLPFSSLADDRGAATNTPDSDSVRDFRRGAKQEREQIKNQIKDIRQNASDSIRQTKEQAKVDIKDLKGQSRDFVGNLRKSFEDKEQEFKAKIKENKQKFEEEIKQKKEDLKQRLKKIKDEKKKQAVERIDQSMDNLNKRLLDHYTSVLGKLQDVLTRIGQRADEFQSRGVDVSITRQAIDKAVESINVARAAIVAQSVKTYGLQINSEDKLKLDVGKARKQLHDDLDKVKEIVKDAHVAVRNAATSLAGSGTVSGSPGITVSPSTTPIISPEGQ